MQSIHHSRPPELGLAISGTGLGLFAVLGLACLVPEPRFHNGWDESDTGGHAQGDGDEATPSDRDVLIVESEAGVDSDDDDSTSSSAGSDDDAQADTEVDTSTTSDGSLDDEAGETSGSTGGEDTTTTSATGETDETSETSETETDGEDTTETGNETDDGGSETGSDPKKLFEIVVQNRSTSESLSSGHALPLDFDHAALVREGARADGDDLQIIFFDGVFELELDRVLEPGSSFNSQATRLWFSTPEPIGPGVRSGGSFWLRIADERPANVHDDPEEVFLLHDEFNSFRSSVWGWDNDPSGWGNISVSGGILTLSMTYPSRDAGGLDWSRITSRDTWRMRGYAIETRSRASGMHESFDCVASRMAHLAGNDYGDLRGWGSSRSDAVVYYTQSNNLQTSISPRANVLDNQWHKLRLTWFGARTAIALDDEEIHAITASNPRPSDQSVHASVLAMTAPYCNAAGTHRLDTDWIRLRPHVEPEPIVSLDLGD